MTKNEIVFETIEYYGLNARATHDGGCFYKTKDGRMCAVGRCLENPPDVYGRVLMLFEMNIINDSSFKEQYRGHEIDFWIDLQTLHDIEHYWNTCNNRNTLTPCGNNAVEHLLNKWRNK